MNHRHPLSLLALASLGALLAAPALAQDTSHYYGGVSVGQSKTEVDAAGVTAALLPGAAVSSSTTDEKDTAYKLFGGYQFNRNIAIEGGYFNLGEHSFNAIVPGGNFSGRTKVEGLNLDLVGTLPMTERFSVIGRIGAQQAWSKSSFGGTAAAASSSKRNDANLKVGLGAQYELSPSMWIRGEIERYRIKDAVGQRQNVDVASVSLVFPFGRAAPKPVAAAPAYVAPPPAPVAPVAVYVAPPPPPPAPVAVVVPAKQRVSFSADTLFGFDAAAVRPEGKTALDTFSNQLMGTTYDSISVEGYTDRKGSDAYNQTLSGERANSVKDYLVTNGKIDPTKISAVGKGESSPVTKMEDCSDKLSRAQLITCLQPDRRVEVEVTGTR
jgi:OOP family OmpA-OmpF porin